MVFRVEPISDDDLDKLLDNFIVELEPFFGITWKWNRPSIFLVENRNTIDLIKRNKTPSWLVGWSSGKDIFILSKKCFEKESCHKYSEKEYNMLLKHELVHCFCNVVFPWMQKPLWLMEGVAIYLSGQYKAKGKPEKFEEFLGYVESGGERLYVESGAAVEILIREFGWEKVVELIRGLKGVGSAEDFEVLFKDIFGFEVGYEEFNRKLK